MALVYLPWFAMKYISSDQQLSPLRYSQISGKLHHKYPILWSEEGPRSLQSRDLKILSRLKWKLIEVWANRTTKGSERQFLNEGEVSAIGKVQETLVKKWTSEIRFKSPEAEASASASAHLTPPAVPIHSHDEDYGTSSTLPLHRIRTPPDDWQSPYSMPSSSPWRPQPSDG